MNQSSFIIITSFMLSLIIYISSSIAGENTSPFYLELGVGGTKNSDTQQRNSDPGAPQPVKAKHATGGIISMSLGYKYSPAFRFALNISQLPKWRASVNNIETDGGTSYYHSNISSTTTTLNGYYDIEALSMGNFSPYIMGGLGVSRNEVNDVEEYIDNELSAKFYGNSRFNLAWRLGAGVNYKINEQAFIGLGYNFVSLGGVKTKSGSDSYINSMMLSTDRLSFKKIRSHQFLIGIGIKL
jgi:opacity protein-like surface antigen